MANNPGISHFTAPAGAPPAAPVTPPPGAAPVAPPPGAPPAALNLPGIGTVQQNPDGSFTILSGPKTGAVIQQTPGGVVQRNPDGTGTMLTGPHAGTSLKPTSNGWVDIATGVLLAPAVGGVTAAADTASGHFDKVPGDIGYGMTGGVVGNGPGSPTTGLVNPESIGLAGKAVGKDIDTAGGEIKAGADAVGDALGGIGLGGGGSGITIADADAETKRANALADALGVKSDAAGAQADTDRGLGNQTRGQQEASIQDLTDAAHGVVPSAAELQLKKQAGIDAARQYGLAAALQGSNPAAALRQASMGAATVAGTANQDAATLRANEQANARTALANTLANVRQGDQGAVNTDVSQQGTLTSGQLTSQGQGVTSTGQKLTAETEKEKADAIRQGALLSAAGSAGATLLSDKRAKEDIRRENLADAIGKNVHGVTFEYAPGEGDRDPHFGILAQEIERVIPGVVKSDPRGMKRVDAGHLTLGNTAVIAELARRIQELETKGGKKAA